jgi:hypothetical protein
MKPANIVDSAEIKRLVPKLFAITAQLEAAAPGRKFTPDGHTVGSIGEVLAASDYGLTLATASTEGVDAIAPDGREVEIKATCRERNQVVCLRSCKPGLHLLVVWLQHDGSHETVFNGPAVLAWEHAGPLQKNGQRPVGFKKLRYLQGLVPQAERLPLGGLDEVVMEVGSPPVTADLALPDGEKLHVGEWANGH